VFGTEKPLYGGAPSLPDGFWGSITNDSKGLLELGGITQKERKKTPCLEPRREKEEKPTPPLTDLGRGRSTTTGKAPRRTVTRR